MSPREKKLLTLFAVAGFVMVNAIGLSLWKTKNAAIQDRLLKAERTLNTAEQLQLAREARIEEMEWLAARLPKPAENQEVTSALLALSASSARSTGLEVKEEAALPTEDKPGNDFRRARVELRVSGSEEALYRWLDKVNTPDQLRHATRLVLTPNRQDDTLIDCKATIEQWFIPPPPSA